MMSILPGEVRSISSVEKLAHHCSDCGKPATRAMAGDMDSFGVDWIYLCDEHVETAKKAAAEPQPGECDRCKKRVPHLVWTRDAGEGTHGPVYHVCPVCRDMMSWDYEEDEDWEDD